MDDRLTDSL
jgi:ubiquitin thioesterase protein OTUB1